MKEKRQLKPSTQLAPVPAVLVSCARAEGARPNLVTVAWAGTVNSDPPMLSIALRASRYSHEIISESGEFAVNLISRSLVRATDYCGVVSGREIDKFEACELTPVPLAGMSHTPSVCESPLVLGCRVRQVIPLGTHDLFLAEIVSVEADESLFDRKGTLHLEQADLVAYAHGHYYELGEELGFFGYSIAREDVLKKRLRARRKCKRRQAKTVNGEPEKADSNPQAKGGKRSVERLKPAKQNKQRSNRSGKI